MVNFKKQQKGKRFPSDLAQIPRVAKVSDHFDLKWLPIAIAEVKAGNTSETLLNEVRQIYIFFVSSKRNY